MCDSNRNYKSIGCTEVSAENCFFHLGLKNSATLLSPFHDDFNMKDISRCMYLGVKLFVFHMQYAESWYEIYVSDWRINHKIYYKWLLIHRIRTDNDSGWINFFDEFLLYGFDRETYGFIFFYFFCSILELFCPLSREASCVIWCCSSRF